MVVILRQRNTLQFHYFWDSINVSEQSFPNSVLKIFGYIFRVKLLWLKIIENDSKIFEVASLWKSMLSGGDLTQTLNAKTVQKQGSPISISSESSKIHILIKVLFIWFNLCRKRLVTSCSYCLRVLALSSATLSFLCV